MVLYHVGEDGSIPCHALDAPPQQCLSPQVSVPCTPRTGDLGRTVCEHHPRCSILVRVVVTEDAYVSSGLAEAHELCHHVAVTVVLEVVVVAVGGQVQPDTMQARLSCTLIAVVASLACALGSLRVAP